MSFWIIIDTNMKIEEVMSAIGNFLKRGCLTLIVGVVGVFVLLWGIGTCMDFDDKTDDNTTESETYSTSTFGGSVESSERDVDAVDVPFDESSTVILGE